MIMIGHRQPPRCESCRGLGDVFYSADLEANVCEDCEAAILADDAGESVHDDEEEITEAEYFQILTESCQTLSGVLGAFGEDIASVPTEEFTDPDGIELLASLKRNADFWIKTADALTEAAAQATAITNRLTTEDSDQ
ncbi:hypothetical protein [Neorhodopirellula pilleata]|uniref:Uncharacterized protein n=1 Tax=Neorhodopirellula pilleata TaxID=2714738 RepID=A0A5C5ZSW7_9BACT|nr:hypothetical protein [Neorhodopirellula pilleata]TWT89313.1 hypothetical protein Pla100_56300 [Neorhodopirellula pilleata]